jgi:putative ABC transport system ATP-binding protein
MALLRGLRDDGITLVLVTHEPDIAAYAERVIVFKDGMVCSDSAVPVRDAGGAVRLEGGGRA